MMSMKPLDKHLKSVDDYYLIQSINRLIEWNNALEARLSALEHPVERLSEETAPTGECLRCGEDLKDRICFVCHYNNTNNEV